MIRGFDCFSPVAEAAARRAAAAGFQFACRYYGAPGSPKLLLPREAAALRSAGLAILPVFERAAGRALDGSQAGREDAATALHQAADIEQPEGTTIAFAVDLDVDVSKGVIRGLLHGYFAEVRAALAGRYRVGAYGSGAVLSLLLDEGLISVAWLAGAMGWRGSREFERSTRWHMRQFPEIRAGAPGNELGFDYDEDSAISLEQIGAWAPQAPSPGPAPDARSTGPIDLFALQMLLKAEGFYAPAVDGIVTRDGATVRGLVAYSATHRPKK